MTDYGANLIWELIYIALPRRICELLGGSLRGTSGSREVMFLGRYAIHLVSVTDYGDKLALRLERTYVTAYLHIIG